MRSHSKLVSILLFAAVTAGLNAAYAGLKTTAPKKVDLTGLWIINSELSDDPKEILEKKRAKAKSSQRGGRMGGGGMGRGPGGPGGPGGMGGSGGMGGGPQGGRGGDGPGPDRDADNSSNRGGSMDATLDEMIGAPEQLDIKQEISSYTFSGAEQTSACKPGEVAQVSMRDGYVGDRQCGWKSKKFIVELKSPIGLTRVDQYELTKKNNQLVVITELQGGRGPLKGLKIKRTYDRMVAR